LEKNTRLPKPIDIWIRLRSFYGEDAIDVSSVRSRVGSIKNVEEDSGDRPCSSLSKSFKRPACIISRKDEKSVLIKKDTLWDNNLNFVNELPMI
jgi:hypothetical protein